jgi:tetratricopeptide (TPR) repeat protein
MGRATVSSLIRLALSLALLYCTYLVASRAVAQWYFRQPTAERLRESARWDPRNPVYYAALARRLQTSPDEGDPGQVASLFEAATRLSPHQARYWAELGGAYEIAGRLDDSWKAYEQAQQLFPNSPAINWRLANFYLRQGQTEPALEALHMVLRGDASLRDQAFDLAWRAGISPALILQKTVPHEPDVLFSYLHYLTGKKQMEAAGDVWTQILALPSSFDPHAAFPYLDALILEKKVEALQSAWKDLMERFPTLFRRQSYDDSLVNNPDFEGRILNGGLGWRVVPAEGVVVSVDSLTFFDGTHSLKIYFDGKHNLDYHHIAQLVPVKPDTSYRFIGYMRTKGITTDQGPRFELYDYYDSSQLLRTTENLIGSSNWTQQLVDFQTGPQTELLAICVRRPESHKLDNQIAGTAWIDRVTLRSTK